MILGRSPFVVMSRNCLVWSEGIFRWFADKEAIRKKYILWSKTKFGILKLHDNISTGEARSVIRPSKLLENRSKGKGFFMRFMNSGTKVSKYWTGEPKISI